MGWHAGLGRGGRQLVLVFALAAAAANRPSWADTAARDQQLDVAVAAAPATGETSAPPPAETEPVVPAAAKPQRRTQPATQDQRRMMMFLLMNSAGRVNPFGGFGR